MSNAVASSWVSNRLRARLGVMAFKSISETGHQLVDLHTTSPDMWRKTSPREVKGMCPQCGSGWKRLPMQDARALGQLASGLVMSLRPTVREQEWLSLQPQLPMLEVIKNTTK